MRITATHIETWADTRDAQAQAVRREARLTCRVYSVLCAGQRVQDRFSDEVVVL